MRFVQKVLGKAKDFSAVKDPIYFRPSQDKDHLRSGEIYTTCRPTVPIF